MAIKLIEPATEAVLDSVEETSAAELDRIIDRAHTAQRAWAAESPQYRAGVLAAIAAAVEEQGAATQEISRNVQQAARGTHEVSANITDVQRGANETGAASSQVLSAAQSLSGDSTMVVSPVLRVFL